ncbi:hypothetical protein NLI96_g4659 [Meripilus lineatus]|uniref:F-box domain-containing protein n=1 Tax=Meripilus lineatus TaxID=2056292 RepID=A0AAD5YHT1_9APHY|nr:hypothetical protein NLI96_g4659 [Physisporinus lineatus]
MKSQLPSSNRTSRSMEHIDIEIAYQRRHLCFLTTERNRRASAVNCPPEILTEVFCRVMRDIIENLLRFSYASSVKGYLSRQLAISHVCHHWRAVVLRSQAYWRYQPIGEHGFWWSPEVVQRAGEQPLHLWMILDQRTQGTFMEQSLSRALSRAVSLYIAIPFESHSSNASRIVKLIPRSSPLLESLVVLKEEAEYCPFGIHDFTGFPRLRNLVVDDFGWSWESMSLVPTLTRLTLRGQVDEIWDEQCPVILMQLTNLRTLKIMNTMPPRHNSQSNLDLPLHKPTIKMPHLQHLRIGADPASIATILQQFELSYHTSVSIHCTYLRTSLNYEVDFAQLNCVLDWIDRYLRGLDKAGTEICSLHIQEKTRLIEELSVILRIWTSRLHPTSQSMSTSITRPQLKLVLANYVAEDDQIVSEDDSNEQLRAYLEGIMHLFDFTRIRNLHVDVLEVTEKLRRVFDTLPKVEVLSLSGDEVGALLRALSPRKRNSKRSQLPVLHSVHTLIIRDSDYFIDNKISKFVDYRLNGGRPLEGLRLIRCTYVKLNFVEELRQKVPSVEWVEGDAHTIWD